MNNQHIRSQTVTIGRLFDALALIAERAMVRAYGSISPELGVECRAVSSLCDGLREALTAGLVREESPTPYECTKQRPCGSCSVCYL